MNPILYFLRSSEQYIVNDMLTYVNAIDTADSFASEPYKRFYGLNNKDMGLYALVDNKIAGAVWIRLYKVTDNILGYVDEYTPVAVVAVKPEYRNTGIEKAMLEQLFLDAGSIYDRLSMCIPSEHMNDYISLGFESLEGHSEHSVLMVKKLSKTSVVRPSDGYDPRRWMD